MVQGKMDSVADKGSRSADVKECLAAMRLPTFHTHSSAGFDARRDVTCVKRTRLFVALFSRNRCLDDSDEDLVFEKFTRRMLLGFKSSLKIEPKRGALHQESGGTRRAVNPRSKKSTHNDLVGHAPSPSHLMGFDSGGNRISVARAVGTPLQHIHFKRVQ